jgi:hypothetical protein
MLSTVGAYAIVTSSYSFSELVRNSMRTGSIVALKEGLAIRDNLKLKA